MVLEDPVAWVALSLLHGLGPLQVRRALREFGSARDIAFRIPPVRLAEALGLGQGRADIITSGRRRLEQFAEREILEAERLGIRLLAPPDPSYPSAFEQLPDSPILLYVKGLLDPGVVRIAVVGSRRATAYGRRVATGLASGLSLRGVEIVSGGARGIDTCAHLGALDGGGRTIAVMGSGFKSIYPAENASLFDKIAENGAVMTEFRLDMEPKGENFPRRNRLIAGLAAAVVVVEAAERSGSLSTAAHALEQGREVMAVPGPVSSDQSVGCHRLIQQGAKLVQKVEDVLDELSPMYAAALRPAGPPLVDAADRNPVAMDSDEAAVLALLDDPEPVHLNVLADRATFGIARLQAAIFGLELRGAVEQLPGQYYLARFRK